ncbi:MAG: autotransporter outer membrane beta-barrel domain-containing protein [Xanthobacteraceae bacterium]|nr:autotransporter outer membrane beta-barrel domain-containing protein [Xanthobacteraceae bacterium]
MKNLGRMCRAHARRLYGSATFAGAVCAVSGVLGSVPAQATPPPSTTLPSDQAAGQESAQTTQTTIVVVNTTIQIIRDGLQSILPTGQTGQLAFSADGLDELGIDALGYSGKRKRIQSNPLYKAPLQAKPVSASRVIYAVWGQGYVDREWRDASNRGIDFGRRSTTVGGIMGFDAVITNVRTSNDAVVVGLLASETSTTTKGNDNSKTHTRGPGVGVYAAYVVGQFSVDGVYKADFFNLTRTAPNIANLDLGMTNHVVAANFSYKIPLQNAWWVEPTVGFSRTWLNWDDRSAALGYENGREWRVQGGARTGLSYNWNTMRVDPSMSFILYSPVSVEGGAIPVASGQPASPLDEGKVFGQVIGKMNFAISNLLSSYVEGEVRGGHGVLGAAGRLGVRRTLQ